MGSIKKQIYFKTTFVTDHFQSSFQLLSKVKCNNNDLEIYYSYGC